jgi:hypothetical protein
MELELVVFLWVLLMVQSVGKAVSLVVWVTFAVMAANFVLVESVVMVVAVPLSLLMVCLGGGKTERESKRTRERVVRERERVRE